jgi:hypothetical protein
MIGEAGHLQLHAHRPRNVRARARAYEHGPRRRERPHGEISLAQSRIADMPLKRNR